MLTLHIPRIRDGKFSTDLFSRYQRSEQAFVLALMEMVVNGISIATYARNGIPSFRLGASVRWAIAIFPFVLVDAMYLKVREDSRVRSRGSYSQQESKLRALLIEINEKWSIGRKYLDMTDYLEWRKNGKAVSKIVRLS